MGRLCFLVYLLVQIPHCHAGGGVRIGADVFIENHLDLVRGKNVGVITNHTGRLSSGEYLVDALLNEGVDVVALFGPEHGIRGVVAAGESVHDTVDDKTGIRIHSLYGNVKKPTPEMLAGVDVLVYDIQDVGARFYTYISTMMLAMEAAAEKGIPFVVLDRPNPLGGILIDGPVMQDSLRSFVGMLPIPVVYGLTCGELASMINRERWLKGGSTVDLTVVRMEGWSRLMGWSATGLDWIAPSPNIPTSQTATVYPATCFIEATNISEGRGTDRPFETIGAPFIQGDTLASRLNELSLPGVRFFPFSFTPTSSKFKSVFCNGIRLEVSSQGDFLPILTGMHILQRIHQLWPEEVRFNSSFLARLLGIPGIEIQLAQGVHPDKIQASWIGPLEEFRTRSARYHFYGD
jgi:uncharacterized protein YbbC (DUF1343 family)